MTRRLAIVVAVLSLAAGCGRDEATPSPPAAPVVAVVAHKPVTPLPEEAKNDNTAPKVAPSSTQPAPAATPSPAPATPTAEDAAPKGSRERVAVLTPGGPLLLDVWLTIDGRPHTEGFDKLLTKILAAGDTDKDGKSTWTELVENEKFLASKLVGAANMNNYQARMWIETYDVNRDNHIQPSEAKSWLGRGAAAGADAFAVRSEKSFAPQPSAASSVWRFIDGDRDGRLSTTELRDAPAALLSLDADDDRIITPRELATLRDQLVAANPQEANRLRGVRRYGAIRLDADEDAERVHYLLQDAYAPRQDFGPDSFPAFPKLFAQLDANHDGWLERTEMTGIFEIDPHVELAVDFKHAGDKLATVKLLKTSSEVSVARGPDNAQTPVESIVLTAGGAQLVVSAHDLSATAGGYQYQGMDSNQMAARRQIRLMVHDQHDALFDALDANGDLRLGEREIAFCGERLAASDANRDGEIADDELPYAMTVAFLRGEPPQQDSFYAPPSTPREATGDKPPAWFVRADLNGDGDLSRREFLGNRDQFARLDGNSDGYLDRSEVAMLQSADDGSSG